MGIYLLSILGLNMKEVALVPEEKQRRLGPFRSYRGLFQISHVMYRLGDNLKLPFPVSLNQMSVFLISFVFWLALYNLPIIKSILNLFPLKSYVMVPLLSIGSAWASEKYDAAGKSIFPFLISYFGWLFSPKYIYRSRKLRLGKQAIRPSYVAPFRSARRINGTDMLAIQSSPVVITKKSYDKEIVVYPNLPVEVRVLNDNSVEIKRYKAKFRPFRKKPTVLDSPFKV